MTNFNEESNFLFVKFKSNLSLKHDYCNSLSTCYTRIFVNYVNFNILVEKTFSDNRRQNMNVPFSMCTECSDFFLNMSFPFKFVSYWALLKNSRMYLFTVSGSSCCTK